MYFKCEFPICHPSILLPAKHIEPTSVFHRWSEMGVECECRVPLWREVGRQGELSLQAAVHQGCVPLSEGCNHSERVVRQAA